MKYLSFSCVCLFVAFVFEVVLLYFFKEEKNLLVNKNDAENHKKTGPFLTSSIVS